MLPNADSVKLNAIVNGNWIAQGSLLPSDSATLLAALPISEAAVVFTSLGVSSAAGVGLVSDFVLRLVGAMVSFGLKQLVINVGRSLRPGLFGIECGQTRKKRKKEYKGAW